MKLLIIRTSIKFLSLFLRNEIELVDLVNELEKLNKVVYKNFDKEFVTRWDFYWANLEIALAEFAIHEIPPDEINAFVKENAISFVKFMRATLLLPAQV